MSATRKMSNERKIDKRKYETASAKERREKLAHIKKQMEVAHERVKIDLSRAQKPNTIVAGKNL